jgi:hypothetical protein
MEGEGKDGEIKEDFVKNGGGDKGGCTFSCKYDKKGIAIQLQRYEENKTNYVNINFIHKREM